MRYQKPRPRERNQPRPAMRLLLAQSDEDPNAVLIDVRPVDLTSETVSCLLCGRKHKTER
jgi:hypothetical protein